MRVFLKFLVFMVMSYALFFLGMLAGVQRVDSIESNVKLKPKIELIIKDNKVDTLYVYKKK